MEELEKKIKGISTKVGKLAVQIERNAEDIGALKGIDSEKKAYSDLLRSVVLEMADVLLNMHENAVEEKTRKRVDKLRVLVNPLR